MPSVSKNQQIAAAIALKAKEEGKSPKKGTASAQMAKMSQDELKKFAKTKHAGLPRRVKKKKRAKKVSEAFGQKLDTYIQIIDRWLENQEFTEQEIDTILNDPDNMDMIESGEAHGINPTLIAQDLKTEEILVGQAAQMHESQKFVAESINEFLHYGSRNTYGNEGNSMEMDTDNDLEFASEIFWNEYLPNRGFISKVEGLDNIVADFSTYLQDNYYENWNPAYDKTIYKEIVEDYLEEKVPQTA
jgi:hypothetical protein